MINSIMVSSFFFQVKDCLRLSDQNIQPFIGPTVKGGRLCVWQFESFYLDGGMDMNRELVGSLKKESFYDQNEAGYCK